MQIISIEPIKVRFRSDSNNFLIGRVRVVYNEPQGFFGLGGSRMRTRDAVCNIFDWSWADGNGRSLPRLTEVITSCRFELIQGDTLHFSVPNKETQCPTT